MKIVGISMVRNEECFLDRALRNVRDFCDVLIGLDNESTDRTHEILEAHCDEVHVVSDLALAHDVLAPYLGEAVWILGVDGDELYDPEGLIRLREWLPMCDPLAFMLGGVYLHVTLLTDDRVEGHVNPRIMRFRNMALVESWLSDGRCLFQPNTLQLRPGAHRVFAEVPWELAIFRCIHVRFLERSSADGEAVGRRMNLQDALGFAGSKWDKGGDPRYNERHRYRQGPSKAIERPSWTR